MTTPSPEVSGFLQRIFQFGSATETLFSRLYNGLHSRKSQETQHQLETQRQAQIEKRHRQLRRMLYKSQMRVERLEAILNHVSEGIILQDLEGRVIDMNPSARELIGSERNFWNSDIAGLFSTYREIATVQSELTPLGSPHRITLNQRVVGAQFIALADSRGERFGTLILLQDITKDELSSRLKNSFVTHISHELRTPLAPMRVASEILLNTPEGKAPNRRMLELISRNVDVLDRMVNEMIDISAMSSDQFEIRHDPIALEPLLADILDEFADEFAEAKITDVRLMLRDTNALHILGDEKNLRWAISNLIRNSIAYSEPHQKVVVRARQDTVSIPAHIIIEVADTGVGISPKDMPYIFDLFYRGDARTRNGKKLDPRGLGQGLYVSRTVARAHGGYLTAQSQQYEGSLFTLGIPSSVG